MENKAYKQEAPDTTNRFNLWPIPLTYIGSSLSSMKEAFQLLEEASKEEGLVVNKGKTKYVVAANTQNCS